ncbi:MAG: sulfatase [Proteobacteria bacterium]|nr:sulfatase [Pseudomonadota bacterium]
MKAIMVMFDSLNRRMLPPYGCDWVKAPNFERLAERSVVFDRCYAGSLPCMPARRELHTGRYNFLHRSWGPIEPFDDSMPTLLKQNGIYTHLVSDHMHYWEDGGATYHTRYNSWEVSRGQEGDFWKGEVKDPERPENVKIAQEAIYKNVIRQDFVNRKHMREEKDQPQAKTFGQGCEFIATNHREDNWFLQIETFDPHEPFFTQQKYKDLYPHEYNGPHFDWPSYGLATEPQEEIDHCVFEYAALVSMCDAYLGKVLDLMDQYDLWKDTLLIVNTDHGFLLGEKDWWGKMIQPIYNEVAHTPLFVWDPRSGKRGERRKSLVQTIDVAPTLLEFFQIERPRSMQGVPLKDTLKNDEPIREAGLFGRHGSHVNVTDGRYVYMRAPKDASNTPLYDYTLIPMHMKSPFSVDELKTLELAEPFSFTKGCRTLKIESISLLPAYIYGSMLFDLENDPNQENPLVDTEIEKRMAALMVDLMKENDAPPDQFERLGLPLDGKIEETHLDIKARPVVSEETVGHTPVRWKRKGRLMYQAFLSMIPSSQKRAVVQGIEAIVNDERLKELDEDDLMAVIGRIVPEDQLHVVNVIASLVKEKGRDV